MSPGIACRQVRKAYGENVVLDGVDVSVAPGELVALSSPSGGAKTTRPDARSPLLRTDTDALLRQI